MPVIDANYFNVTRTAKRGRVDSHMEKSSKVGRRSISHSAPSTAPSMNVSTSDNEGPPPSPSRSVSPLDNQGASRISGGIFRGKATGNAFKLADAGMYVYSTHNLFSYWHTYFRGYGC
jgi:hypothetical protein